MSQKGVSGNRARIGRAGCPCRAGRPRRMFRAGGVIEWSKVTPDGRRRRRASQFAGRVGIGDPNRQPRSPRQGSGPISVLFPIMRTAGAAIAARTQTGACVEIVTWGRIFRDFFGVFLRRGEPHHEESLHTDKFKHGVSLLSRTKKYIARKYQKCSGASIWERRVSLRENYARA